MSSHEKDPLEKHDTPSESGEQQSESEVSEAEDHLEHLKIAERAAKRKAKDGTVEMKPLDSPNLEAAKGDLSNEPGPSGLQNPVQSVSDSASNSEQKDVDMLDSNNESLQEEFDENIEAEVGDENIEAEVGDENIVDDENIAAAAVAINPNPAEDASSRSRGDSGHVSIAYIRSHEEPAAPIGVRARRRAERDIDDAGFPDLQQSSSSIINLPSTDSARSSLDIPDFTSSSAEISDSEKTSEGIPDIHSHLEGASAGGSVYHDAAENVPMEHSTSVYKTAVERQYSESSDANVSDLPEDSIPSSSVSISTNTGEEGNQAYLAKLQREADERGVQFSTSSGVGSTDQSELANLQQWRQAGEMGYRPNLENIIDYPDQEGSELGACGGVPRSMQDEQNLESQRMQDYGGFFEQAQRKGKNEKEVSPSVRRKTKFRSDSSSPEHVAGGVRPRIKTEAKKSKLLLKSGVFSRSTSESPIPKSTSSDEMYRKDSPDIKSSSCSRSEGDKKSWQRPGQLRSMQRLTVPSENITEEEESMSSPRSRESMESKDKTPEKMESKDKTPEKMEITPEKNTEDSTIDSSEQRPSTSEQAHGSADATLSLDFSDAGRSVGKAKRPGGKLSSSPPSDEMLSTTPTDAPLRPKKKAREDGKQAIPRRKRTDSESSITSVEGVDQKDSGSPPNVSDFSESE